jgi:hypothetical protein
MIGGAPRRPWRCRADPRQAERQHDLLRRHAREKIEHRDAEQQRRRCEARAVGQRRHHARLRQHHAGQRGQ